MDTLQQAIDVINELLLAYSPEGGEVDRRLATKDAQQFVAQQLKNIQFSSWEGGAYRPVAPDTYVQVKYRNGTTSDAQRARDIAQIRWMHHHYNDPARDFDVIAYRVV